MRLSKLIELLETLAPPRLSESWDNTGLLLGDREAEIQQVLTCLTLTPDIAEEACAKSVQLIVTHHPVLFKAVQKLTSDTTEGGLLLKLAQRGIAVYSPHTAWDNSSVGINQQLAELLQLQEIRPLRPGRSQEQYHLVTYVPESDLERVQQALWKVGCGKIGAYEQCSFFTAGTGTFFGTSGTDPTIGKAGQLERVAEFKLEMVCPKPLLATALNALRNAHSYEEPAIDVLPREATADGSGSGRYGLLPHPLSLQELAALIDERLGCRGVQFVGNPDRQVTRVGVACGAAAEYWRDARRQNCQALITGEARFHTGLEARAAGMGLIIAGHYPTERFAMERLADLITQQAPGITAQASAVECDPFQFL